MIPAPKVGNWKVSYGSWENFCKVIHISIGRKIGSGVLQFSTDWDELARKAEISHREVRGAHIEDGGSEHVIIEFEAEPDRVFKATFGDNLGCRSDLFRSDPELTGRHFHPTGNADPFFYLRRWLCLNSISGYKTRYEGIIPLGYDGHLPRICVSQPVIIASNPTERQIEQALKLYGYRKISGDAFLNDDNGVLLTDAAPRNVRIVDGVPIPFDAIAEIAPPAVLQWAGE